MESMIGVIVTVVVLITVGGTLFVVFKMIAGIQGKQAATQRLIATGMPGTARILELGSTGTSMSIMGQRQIEIVLTLEVTLPGQAPYMAQLTQFISDLRLASVQPGAQVHVRVDPTNPNVLAIADAMPGGAAMAGYGQAPGIQNAGGGWGGTPGAGGGPVIRPTAGTVAPGGAGGAPGWGAPPGGQPAWGQAAPMTPMTAAGAPGAGFGAPNLGQAMRKSFFSPLRIIVLFLTTVPIVVVMLAVFVDWSAYFDFGDDSSPKGGYCEGTVRCCKVVFGSAPSANCDAWKNLPAAGCKSTWESYSKSAKSQGKTCK